MRLLVLFAGVALTTGCAHYGTKHEVTVTVTDPNTKVVTVTTTKDNTSAGIVLMKGDAAKVRSSTKDGTYSRSLSVGTIQGQGDAEFIKAVIEGTGTAIGNAGHSAVTGAP